MYIKLFFLHTIQKNQLNNFLNIERCLNDPHTVFHYLISVKIGSVYLFYSGTSFPNYTIYTPNYNE